MTCVMNSTIIKQTLIKLNINQMLGCLFKTVIIKIIKKNDRDKKKKVKITRKKMEKRSQLTSFTVNNNNNNNNNNNKRDELTPNFFLDVLGDY